MTLREELADYTDAYGLVHPNKNPGPNNWSGNGLLFTAEALMLIYKDSPPSVEEQREIERIYNSCEAEAMGLYRRHPVAFLRDQEAIDDYIGIGAAAYITGTGMAVEVLEYGRAHHWLMNNVDGKWNWSAWLGRFPAMICHLEFAAGGRSSLWKRLWWALTVAFQPWSSESDPILSWLMVTVCAKRSFVCSLATDHFYRRLKKRYPGKMRQVFEIYFNSTDHPIAKFMY